MTSVPVLETYTGMDLVALVSAGYDFSAFYPNREGWNRRYAQCDLLCHQGRRLKDDRFSSWSSYSRTLR